MLSRTYIYSTHNNFVAETGCKIILIYVNKKIPLSFGFIDTFGKFYFHTENIPVNVHFVHLEELKNFVHEIIEKLKTGQIKI